MRNKLLMVGAAALLVVSTTVAWAQDAPQPTPTPSNGILDIGGRFTSTTGDGARYERYRDLRDGVNANLLFSKETEKWVFDIKAKNIGYRDQRYLMDFNSRRLKLSLSFSQSPLNYSYDSRTPYVCTAGDCSLDAGLRAQVEAGKAVGIPQNVGQLLTGTIYNTIARPFDMQSRRDTFAGEARISATDNFDFILGFNTYKRSGNMPWGGNFAFSVLQEMPLVLDNRESEMSVGVEWASHQGMFNAKYERAKFDQNIPTFRWDNPQRATDFCRFGNASTPPGTCYDPSGYSNGNGPNDGLSAMPPSNSRDTFSTMAMLKLPGRTTANASLSVSSARQDAALIGWTTNPVIANPVVYASFPELARLPRDTAQMRVGFTTATASLRSRLRDDLTLSARYRYNGRNDFTRPFEAVEYVRMDAVPEETGGASEPFNIDRNTVDIDAAYTGISHTSLKVGYTYYRLQHGIRTTQGYKDGTARVSLDTVGSEHFTLRAIYEHTNRDTINLSEEAIVEGGLQPAARYYDEAARKSDRATLILELTPTEDLGFNLSVAHGKDDYKKGDPLQEFGLLNNKSTTYSAGLNYAPSPKVNLGADYGYEKFEALQESRNANPAPDPSWTDPSRNWSLNNDDKVKTFTAYLNLVKPIAKTDIRASYDYNDSDQSFVHGGPRIAALSAINQFVALPNITNKWQRATIDLRYQVSAKVGLGAAWWYEKAEVRDFSTVNTAGPQTLPVPALGPQTDTARIDWLGNILTGYGNRPYSGNTVFVRMFYLF